MNTVLTMLSEDAGATVPSAVAPAVNIDVTGVDFMQVLTVMMDLLPTMLPVAVACVAFRKGLSFILSFVRGA